MVLNELINSILNAKAIVISGRFTLPINATLDACDWLCFVVLWLSRWLQTSDMCRCVSAVCVLAVCTLYEYSTLQVSG